MSSSDGQLAWVSAVARRRVIRRPLRTRLATTAALTVAALGLVAAGGGGGPAAGKTISAVTAETPSNSAFRIGLYAWSASISYNPYSPDTVPYASQGFAQLGLAAVPDNPPKGHPFYPEMASSWKVKGSTITLNLRKGAKWQDGSAFTSRDVLTSLLLAGAALNPAWSSLSGVSAPNKHQVVLRMQPWAVPQNVLNQVFQINIVPNSQYSQLLKPGVASDIVTYWKTYNVLHPTSQTVGAASAGAAGKTLSSVSTALFKYNPPNLLGDGPFKLMSANVNGILYKKWSGFWGAKSISIPYVEVLPMANNVQFGALLSGGIDAETDASLTDPEAQRLNATSNGHYVYQPEPLQVESLVLHLADYPYNLLPVRKAIMYAINRTTLTKLDLAGDFAQNPPQPYPDGISDTMAKRYLTKKQLSSLNPYAYSPTKAASLLRGAGFKKSSGTWMMPNGKPFKLQVTEPSGDAQLDQDGLVIAKMLKNFGIDAQTIDANSSAYTGEELAGHYPVSENFLDWGVGSPLADFASTFFSAAGSATGTWNYPPSYTGSGKFKYPVSIGVGPMAKVPGLGKVNVAQALNSEINTSSPKQWSKLTWDWARWINRDLPILPLYDNDTHIPYSTARYTDWPTKSTFWQWLIMPYLNDDFVFMMQHGYLKLRG